MATFKLCCALDGEDLSNTLYMERTMMWSGVLIEADQTSFGKLLSRRRKSYALPICLSLQPYPTRVVFKVTYAFGSIQESLTPEQLYKRLSGNDYDCRAVLATLFRFVGHWQD
jgi:hypothetical protein